MSNGAKLLLLVVLVGIASTTVEASHFRYGTISWWVADPQKPNVVTFRVNTAWRDSFFSANVGDTFSPGSICYENGTACVSMASVKQSEFLADDWMTGQFGPDLGLATTNYVHTFPAQDGSYIVSHSSSARIGALKNNANANWRISALVKIRMGAGQAILRSPVSNTLPIVPVRWGVSAATFQLSATAINSTSPITFRMATGAEMGGSGLIHPATLSAVNPTTGILSMDTSNLAKNSLWTTQQIITDTLTGVYVPIDYIIQVKEFNTFCSPGCSNALTPCGSNANCFNCGAVNPSCISSAPELINSTSGLASVAGAQLVPPVGGVINVNPGDTVKIAIVAHDLVVNDPAKPVTIYIGSLPPNASVSAPISCGSPCSCATCNQPKVRMMNWSPSASNLGDHTTCIGVRSFDGTELSYSQHCFTINVARRPCGSGNADACGGFPNPPTCNCTCPSAGFDVLSNCLQCNQGYYGPKCTSCQSCNGRGVCDSGMLGSGACLCNPGFTGLQCETVVNSRCNPSATASILRSTTSVNSRVNPVSAQLLVSSSSTFNLNLALNAPAKPTIDIVIAQDVSSGITIDDTNAVNTYISTFLSNLASNVATSPLVGIATFNALDGGSYRRVASLTSDSSVLKQKTSGLFPTTPPPTNSTSYSMEALRSVALDSGYGWRSDAFKICIVLTNKNFAASANLSSISSVLVEENVVPIFLSRNGAAFAGANTTFGFGASNDGLGSPANNWATLADAAIRSVISRVVVKVSDPSGIVQLPLPVSSTIALPSTTNLQVTFQTPAVALAPGAALPVGLVSVMGWGQSQVTLSVNRPPVASATQVVGNENQMVSFSVVGTDADNNILSTTFTTLPALGKLQTTSGVDVVASTNYNGTNFNYLPAINFYNNGGPSPSTTVPSFTFTVDDGCATSAGAAGTIRVNFVNQAPVALVASFAGQENSNLTLNLATYFYDMDHLNSTLVVKIVTTPSSIGRLFQVGGGLIVGGQELGSSQSVVFVGNTNEFGAASFSYQVRDPLNAWSAVKSVTVTLADMNQPPTLRTDSGSTNYTMEIFSECYTDPVTCPFIPLFLEDPDVSDTLSIIVTRVNCLVSEVSPGCASALTLQSIAPRPTLGGSTAEAYITDPLQPVGTSPGRKLIFSPIPNNGPEAFGPLVQPTPFSPFLQRSQFNLYIDFILTYAFSPASDDHLIVSMLASDGATNSSELTLHIYPQPISAPRPIAGAFTTVEDTTVTVRPSANPAYPQPTGNSFATWGRLLLFVSPPRVTTDNTLTKVNDPGFLSWPGTVVTNTRTWVPVDYRNITNDQDVTENWLVAYNINYTPGPNFHGRVAFDATWAFTYTNDSLPIACERLETYTITISPVNDPPTTSGFSVTTLQDKNVTIDGFTAESMDWTQTQLTLVITSLPTNGTLAYENGSPLAVGSFLAGPPSNWRVVFSPPPTAFSVRNSTDTTALQWFDFAVRDGASANSSSATVSIVVINVDDPPYSANTQAVTDENVAVKVSFPLFDIDGQEDVDLSRAIIFIPDNFRGKLWLDDAKTQPVVSGNATGVGPSGAYVWYEPPFDQFSFNADQGESPATKDPLESFTFKVETMNAQQLQSTDIYTASLHVQFVNQPPRFVGLLRRTIDEDTTDDVVLVARDDNTAAANIVAAIVGLPNRGVLRDGLNDEAMPIMDASIQSPHVVSSEGRAVAFTPGLHENGMNYADLTFKLVDSLGAEATYTITYDVLPVNTPPEVDPINFNRTVLINEGESTTLLFSASDVDDSIDSLSAVITTLPLRGEVFECQSLTSPCPFDNSTGALALGLGAQMINLTKLDSAKWGVHFVPEQLQGFASYTLAFRAIDPHGAQSAHSPVTIRVLPVNDPPVLTVQDQYDTFVSQAVNIIPSVVDPDAGVIPILVEMLIQPGGPSGTALDLTDSRAFSSRLDTFRNKTEEAFCVRNSERTNITCTAPQAILNDIIGTLQFIPTEESNPSTLVITVNDLGAGGNPTDPTNAHLTDTKSVVVTVQPPAAIVEGTNNLTWAAVAAAGAGVLLAIVLGVIIRRKMKRVDEKYFDAFGGSETEGVANSPLYQEGKSKGENALFDGRRTVELEGGGHDGVVGPKPDASDATASHENL